MSIEEVKIETLSALDQNSYDPFLRNEFAEIFDYLAVKRYIFIISMNLCSAIKFKLTQMFSKS